MAAGPTATLRAKKALSLFMANRGKSMAAAMRGAGYSPASARNPKNLTETKTFKDTLQQLGLTDDLLVGSLVSDIKAKPKRRFKELELGFKVTGRLSPEGFGQTQTNIQINITGNGGSRFDSTNATVVDANTKDNSQNQ